MNSSIILTKKNLPAILTAGLIAGTLDISAAMIKFFIERGKGPEPIFRYIASGLFGSDAFTGSQAFVIWGIAFHFLIAMSFTFIFLALYPFVSKFIRNWFVLGIVFGVVTWVVMNLIVVPLSNVPGGGAQSFKDSAVGMAILILCIGLPISYAGNLLCKKRRD